MARILVTGLLLGMGLSGCSSSSTSPDTCEDTATSSADSGAAADSGRPNPNVDAGVPHDADGIDDPPDADDADGSMTRDDDARASSERDADTDILVPLDAGPLVVANNLLANSSFEEPNELWEGFANSQLEVVDERAHTGRYALKVTARTQDWEGPAVDFGRTLIPGASYRFRVWVLVDEEELVRVGLNTRINGPCALDAGGWFIEAEAGLIEQYAPLTSGFSQGEWVELNATFTTSSTCHNELMIYVEGPPPGTDFYIDDASLVLQD